MDKIFGSTSANKKFYKELLDTLKDGKNKVYGTKGRCRG